MFSNTRQVLAGVLLVASAAVGCAAPRGGTLPPAPGVDNVHPVTGLTTLYFRDPLARSMSFATGAEGGVFQDHMAKNRGSDIDFGHYSEGGFSVGIEGGVIGSILDLGSRAELQQRYGYSETVGGGQGFASIRFDGNGFVILEDYDTQSTQPLREADTLFEQLGSCLSAPVVSDHVYLVALRDRHDPDFQRLVKFHVVALVPGESVTLRWYRLEG